MTSNIALWIFIALLLAGGLVGFLKAGSKASLIASSLFALPLVLTALHIFPIVVAEVVLAILCGYMAMKFGKSRKFMPSGMIAILSALTLLAQFLSK